MKRLLMGASLMCCCVLTALADTPLWMRDPRISPDGKEIVFCYKGDIYKVPTEGGSAVRLTAQSSYEYSPVWSPDGKQIAFASDRNGDFDVYLMPSSGGSARRLTYYSAVEIPYAFSPDGKYVFFSASIQDPVNSALYPSSKMPELYKVSVEGGRTELVLGTPAEYVCCDKEGTSFLYHDKKGGENEWRKHHTSSATRDVWLYDCETETHTNLTNREGEDRNPVYAPDGKTVYFLSERDKGSFNVYSLSLDNPEKVSAVSNFKTLPVRFLSISNDGLLCYSYDGEIYTQTPGSKPQKVEIDLISDDVPNMSSFKYTSGASSACVSPNGKQVAFVIRGDIFVTSTNYVTTKQITDTPASEADPSFSPDSKTLIYASERTGNWQLYTAKLVRKGEANFPNATLIKEEVLLPSKTVERRCPKFSPDGKEIAFVEDRTRLMVYNLDTKKVRQITDGSMWYSMVNKFNYQWSPDGKWFALEFIGNQHDPYSDIGIVSAKGGEDIINITNSGYISRNPQWVLDGNAILFETDRYGMRSQASWGSQNDAMLVFMNQNAYDRYKLSKEDYELLQDYEREQEEIADDFIDEDEEEENKDEEKDKEVTILVEPDDISDRMVRLTLQSSDLSSVILSKDGDDIYYLSTFADGVNLWKMNLREKEPKRVQRHSGSANLQLDDNGNIFLLGSSMGRLDLKNEIIRRINYQAEMKFNLAEEREAMFNHVYKQEQKCFYDANMHGVDWDNITDAYRKFLPHVDNNYDFEWLLSELLGELNVSHTGAIYYPSYNNSGRSEVTASLGLLFNWGYQGDGMMVAEVLDKSPFDYSYSKIKPGCIVEKIDGKLITTENDISILLNNKAKTKTLVSLYDPQLGERWEEVVEPITSSQMNSLLYDRWVKQRADEVDRWSEGRLGYVHIKEMRDESFRTIYSDILGKYNHCDGIIIDTRFNGGGRLHEDIEVMFSGEKYLTQVIRGRDACDMPSRRWNKPSIMLQCEANYSNACGTPWVYKHEHLGKLVGMPVPGTMTSVSWERLQDPSMVFGIPIVGFQTAEGYYLENHEVEPDIKVMNRPETIVRGEDTQLATAVQELLKEIDGETTEETKN